MTRLLLLLILLSIMAAAATPENEVLAADKLWATAVKRGDTAVLQGMYTKGLIYAHATGKVENKQEYIDRLKSGKQKYSDVIIERSNVVVYGNSAVSHSVVRTIGTNDNGPFNDHVMMMHVWVKQGKGWQLAAHQTTKVP